MNITWYGQSCFQISSSEGKNNRVSIVVDPFGEDIGLKLPRKIEADIVLVTHDHSDHNNVKAVSGEPLVIAGPGEYEAKGVFIRGISSLRLASHRLADQNKEDNLASGGTIYTIEVEGMRLCHLGDLGQKELFSDQLEKIGGVDILMVPVGGVYTANADEAIKVMAQVEPKITIPMHYQVPNLKIKLGGVDKFLKALGIKSLKPLSKLSVKKKDLLSEEAKIIVLQP